MKQFKAEWQDGQKDDKTVIPQIVDTLGHLLTQHNALCEYLEERLGEKEAFEIVPSPRIDYCGACKAEHGYKCPLDCENCDGRGDTNIGANICFVCKGTGKKTITLPKPEWWEDNYYTQTDKNTYLEALSDASKALGVELRLE